MEYSKDIILNLTNEKLIKNKGQVKGKLFKFIEKHKLIATITLLCGILMVLDFAMIYNFIVLLQTL